MCLFYCILLLCLHVPSSSSVSFSYNFSNSSADDPCSLDIVCHPDTEFVRSRGIELTTNLLSESINNSTGRVWYKYPVPLWNEDTGEVASFTTSFSFNITPTNSSQYQQCQNWSSRTGDGMAFFLAPWPNLSSGGVVLPNAATTFGEYLYLFNSSNYFNATGDGRVVAVEFDTYSAGNNWVGRQQLRPAHRHRCQLDHVRDDHRYTGDEQPHIPLHQGRHDQLQQRDQEVSRRTAC